jgi:hypothetical protein
MAKKKINLLTLEKCKGCMTSIDRGRNISGKAYLSYLFCLQKIIMESFSLQKEWPYKRWITVAEIYCSLDVNHQSKGDTMK